MRIPSRPLRTFTGPFQDIRLDFTPEPPLTEQERSHYSQNYPTTLAYLHVYLGEEDATELLPSVTCYGYWTACFMESLIW